MKSWKWICIALQILTVWLSPFLSNAVAGPKKPITFNYSTFFPITHVQAQLGKAWANEVERRSKGNMKIVYFPGTFLKGEHIYEGVVIGAADIGMSAFTYNLRRFPVMEAVDLPLGYPDAKTATSVINDFYEKFKPKELSDVKVLYLHAHGPGLLHSKKPVNKLEDLKRMRIRSTKYSAKVTKALGAIPVVKPQGYTYALLQDNFVDATWGPMEVLKGWRQAEVIKYSVDCHCIAYTAGFYVAMNLKKWNSLPAEYQRIFREVSAEWIPKHGQSWDTSDMEGREYTLSLGNKIVPLSQQEVVHWREAILPVLDEYIKRTEDKGLSGKEYIHTIKELIAKHG